MPESQEVTQEDQGPVPGSDEYNEMMASNFRQSQEEHDDSETPPVPPMPEGGQEKFYNPKTGEYNWQNHAKELQYRLTKDEKSAASGEKSAASDKTSEDEAVKDIVTEAGLDMDALGQSIVETGGIPEDAKKSLVDRGIPEELIDSYIENAKYRLENSQSEALEYVGGTDGWDKMNVWCLDNLSTDEQAAYNEMLAGPGWKAAVDTIKGKMKSATPTGQEGLMIFGDEASSGFSGNGYKSRNQMKEDMKSDKYRNDPTFRKEVASRVAASQFEDDEY